MKRILLLLLIIPFINTYAQEEERKDGWEKGGDIALNFSQVSFSNWAAGGDNAINLNGFFNVFADYKKDKFTWDNALALAYGSTKINEADFRKNDDKIDFASKFGYSLSEKMSAASLLSFKSQMMEGFDYTDEANPILISDFLAPGYFSLGVGVDYKPFESLSIYYSPVSARMIVVNDTSLSLNYGLDAGDSQRFELGSLAKIAFRKDILKNVGLQTTLQLFSNYLENPQDVDIDWEVLINMKINDFLSANFNTNLLYDKDILFFDENNEEVDLVQLKQLFGVGFFVKF